MRKSMVVAYAATIGLARAPNACGKVKLGVMNDTLEVRESSIHGKGVFAKQRIYPNSFVGVFEGERTKRNGTYVLWIEDDKGKQIGIKGRNELRYLNHSRTPNAYFAGDQLFALDEIEPGTEITLDYGEEWVDTE